MISLRWRITLWYVILTVIALGGFMLISYQALSESLRREIDNTLIERANHVTDALSVVPNRPIEGISPESTDEFSSPGVYVQIFDEGGTVVARSFNLGAQQLPFTAIDLEQTLTGDDFYITTQIGSQSVRLYHRPLRREGITVGVVQVGQSLTGLETTLRRLRLIYAIGTAVVLLFGVVGSRWIARRGLQPVTHVAQTARAIVQAEDLTRRVDYSGPPDEIGTLAATFNDMLNRLQTLFESQHRFLAEAAHELRTPLASVLGNIDLLAKYGDDPNRRGETLAAIQRTGKHIARLLDDLLLLAQAEAGWHLQLRPLAADDIFLEVYEAMIPIAGNTVLQLEKCDPAQIKGDPDRLRQVFFNLIHNACKHSEPRGTVTLSLWPENGRVWVQICNTGPGIAPEALKRVYEPFFRETSESSLSGVGLGLTIVRWIVHEHQGGITIKSEPGAGTTVTLSFPLYLS